MAKGKHGALLVATATATTARCRLSKSGGIVSRLPTARTVCARRGRESSHCGLEHRGFTLTTYRRGWCSPLRARLRAVVTRDLGLGSVPGRRRQIIPSVIAVVTRLLVQLHVGVSLCLVISGGGGKGREETGTPPRAAGDSPTTPSSSLRNKRPGLSGRPHCKGMAIGVARRGACRSGERTLRIPP